MQNHVTPPLPKMICVGFGKSGTTTLFYGLSGHPRICLSYDKEAHFFDIDENYSKGLDWYRNEKFREFSGLNEITVDITPAYIIDRRYLERIKESLGSGIKICVIVRHPVLRTFSHYLHDVRLFEVDAPIIRASTGLFYEDSLHMMTSLYVNFIPVLYELFGRENILPLIFERDIQASGPIIGCNKVAAFLGLPLMERMDFNKKAGAGYAPRITIIEEDSFIENDELKIMERVKRGSIVIEHDLIPEGYRYEIIENPDEEQKIFYKNYLSCVTRELSKEKINEVSEKQFKSTIDYVKYILEDDLPEWNIDRLKLPKYEIVESRIRSTSQQ